MKSLYSTGVVVNTESAKIATLPPIINQRKRTPPVIINKKIMTLQGNNGSSKKCYKVMGSQYLLGNNDSPEIIIMKLDHFSAIRIQIGNTKS